MTQTMETKPAPVAEVLNAGGQSGIVLVCEHASHSIPEKFNGLGLAAEDRFSHAAWDPGALAVAEHMAAVLAAPLVISRVSRLVYDCNRPPSAADAMPDRSEVIDVPGNAGLTPAERQARVDAYYTPFQALLAQTIEARKPSGLVTIHSFTPIYKGRKRDVEIGLLHDADARLADAMLSRAAEHVTGDVRHNAPYGPEDGVTHTLKEHALKHGIPNVMIEVRNDLIRDEAQQHAMAEALSRWVTASLASLTAPS
ncbi:MAG: N-formylglutamate amidohydrolase [Pseudomonadota bacterium]